MPSHGRINLRAVRQMVRFVKALIWIMLARLSQLAFPFIGTGGARRGGCLERSIEIRFQNPGWFWRELCRRGINMFYTTIIQRPGIPNNDRLHRRGIWWRQVLSRRITPSPVAREGSPETGLRQLLESEATTSSGVASEPVQEPQTTRSTGGDHFGGRMDQTTSGQEGGGDARKAEAGGEKERKG